MAATVQQHRPFAVVHLKAAAAPQHRYCCRSIAGRVAVEG
jgi:hypothetical protein